MTEVLVDLEFACCACGAPVGVTVRCTGKGLEEGPHTVAAVKIPCPSCGDILQLYFEPSGAVRAVVRESYPRWLIRPSLN